MAVFDPMTIAPVKLVKQWSVEGGRLTTPYGLDVKYIETTVGTVSFVKLDKNADRLLKAILGTATKGALRRSILFHTLGTMLSDGNVSLWIPNAPQKARPPPQSRTRPLPQSRSLNLATPSANWRRPAAKKQNPINRGRGLANRSAGRT